MSATDTLRECHRLRKHLKALQEEIDRGPRVLKAQQARLAQEQQAHKDHFETITKLKLKQRDDEGTLKQTETRLAKLEAQLLGISVPKEYEAKKSEIRQAEEKKAALEDAILATMAELEEKTAAVPAVDKKWAAAQAEFAQSQEDAKARLERLRADQEESRAALAKAEATLPDKNKSTYDHLSKALGPDAFAAVKDRICQGCRTGITQQRVMEVQGGMFLLCSSCGKMLYPAE
ncbi:MAG: putative zinc ribbon domain protein [Gemmataceae bacterium]|nr:putative zinc ribbon domain protein [Gemmataceae bacterium]